MPVYSKDVRLPVQLQRAMAAEAEAAREARAKVIIIVRITDISAYSTMDVASLKIMEVTIPHAAAAPRSDERVIHNIHY